MKVGGGGGFASCLLIAITHVQGPPSLLTSRTPVFVCVCVF